MTEITVQALQKMIGIIELIDVRESNEFHCGHIPTAKNIPVSIAIQQADVLFSKEETYYIVCQSGGRSALVVEQLLLQGYDAVNVQGGTFAWPEMLEY
ncbi:MAG: rhodanese-like domain-containing protein [Culicoidibacterales bacterium]